MDENWYLKELTETADRAKSNTKRIDKIEKEQDALNNLAISVQVLAEKEKTVESDVKEIKNDVKNMTAKSGKRWDNIVDKVLLGIIAAIVAYIMMKLGF